MSITFVPPTPKITEIHLTDDRSRTIIRIDNLDEIVEYFNDNHIIVDEKCRIKIDRILLAKLIGSRVIGTNAQFDTYKDYLIKGGMYWASTDTIINYLQENLKKLESKLMSKDSIVLTFINKYYSQKYSTNMVKIESY